MQRMIIAAALAMAVASVAFAQPAATVSAVKKDVATTASDKATTKAADKATTAVKAAY